MPDIRCAAIIAGGASRRMGSCKALLEIEGETLVARVAGVLQSLFPEVIVVTGNLQIAQAANLPAIADEVANCGPIGGLHAALNHFHQPTFCIACDMPFANARAIEFLCLQGADCDAVLPLVETDKISATKRAEPLHAVYTPACLPFFEAEFQCERVRSVERVLGAARVKFIEADALRVFDAELRFLRNWNSPQDARADGFSLS